MKIFIKFAAFATLALAACTELETGKTPGEGEGGEPLSGETVFISCEAASAATLDINPDDNWQIVSKIDWLSISPRSGFSGENQITIKATSSNTALAERTGSFEINVNGSEPVKYYVAQYGVEGIEVPSNEVSANGNGGETYVYVNANTEFTAAFDQNWASVKNIEYNLSSNTLEDGVTLSKLQTARVVLDVQENPDGNLRSGNLTISCGGKDYTVTVSQSLSNDAEISDFETPFLRRTLAMRFTATWCGYCPQMAESYKRAAKAEPDRFIPMSIHSGDSDVYSECGDDLAIMYNVGGYPTGLVNAYGLVQNYDPSIAETMLTGLVDEAAEELPAKTAISTVSETADGVFKLLCSVATKEARPYKLNVFILEDGVVAEQHSYLTEYPGGSDYVHDYVERCAVTGTEGAPIYGVLDGVVNYSLEYKIPSNVIENMDNAYAVVYVTYENEETFRGSVTNVIYQNHGQIVDNVVKIGLNGSTGYEYAN